METLNDMRDRLATRQGNFYGASFGAGVFCGWNAAVTELQAQFKEQIKENYIELKYHYNALSNVNQAGNSLLEKAKEREKLLVEALEKSKCECKYRPFTHQYLFQCDRCNAIAEHRKAKGEQ